MECVQELHKRIQVSHFVERKTLHILKKEKIGNKNEKHRVKFYLKYEYFTKFVLIFTYFIRFVIY